MKNPPSFCITAFISVFTLCAAIHAADVLQNFNGGDGQTPYGFSRGGNAGDRADGTGEIDGFYRLLNNNGSLYQNLYFQNDGYADNFISVSFDMRMSPAGNGFADGVNFSLADTSYTNLATVFPGPPDLTWLAKSLSWTFQIYGSNRSTLRWDTDMDLINRPVEDPERDPDNGLITRVDNGILRDQFFTANLSINFAPGGAYVYATMMNKATGEIVTMADGQFVPGLLPYTSNVVFGGRTGGETMNADLDNIRVLYNSDANIRWTPGESGTFENSGGHWEGGNAPGEGQTGQIYAGTNTMSGDVRGNRHLLITGGETNTTGGLWVSNNGSITMESGKFTVNGKTVVGNDGGTLGSVTINGGQFLVNPGGEIQVLGDNGDGMITVNGGLYEVLGGSETFLGYWGGKTGTINVNDGVAKFGGRLLIGREGDGVMNVSGGTVQTKNVEMGAENNGNGILNLTGGQMTVDGYLYTNSGNGSTANISLSGGEMTVRGDLYTNRSGNSRTNISLSDSASLTVTGNFYPLQADTGTNPTRFSLEVKDNAYLKINGLFFGGSADHYQGVPMAGESFTGYLTFSGNSVTEIDGEGWLARNAIMKIVIEDNASIISKTGNSGIGCYDSANGSLLEMKGGTFQAINFVVGQNGANVTMDQSGGTLTLRDNFQTEHSVVNLRGSGVINTGSMRVGGGSQVRISGNGQLNVTGTLEVEGADNLMDIAGGKVDTGTMYIRNNGTVALSGGTLKVTNFDKSDGDFNFTAGTLNARNVSFDLAQNGGFLSPGGDGVIGITEIGSAGNPKNYSLNDGAIRLDLDLSAGTSDLLIVYGDFFFGPNAFFDLMYDEGLLETVGDQPFKIMELFSQNTEFTDAELASLLSIKDASFWTVSQDGNGGVWLAPREMEDVPEPGTWAMLVIGGIALGFAARRKSFSH